MEARHLYWILTGPSFAVLILDAEMEFLDINLTKDSSLLVHAIHSPFYWRKTILFSGFKDPKNLCQDNCLGRGVI
jgi:hypothetical protein